MKKDVKKQMLKALDRTLAVKRFPDDEPDGPICPFFLHQPAYPGRKNRAEEARIKDCNGKR